MKTTRLILPDTHTPESLIDNLTGACTMVKDPPETHPRCFYDTFDWRLYGKNLILLEQAGHYALRNLEDETTVLAEDDVTGHPRFWQAFPEGPLRETLRSPLDIRALLPQARVQAETQTLRLLNEDEKTVLRICLETIRLIKKKQAAPPVRRIVLEPVRGYAKYRQQIVQHLKNQGIDQTAEDIFHTALRAAGKKPGSYSSKPDITLTPDTPGRQAARQILNHLLGIIKQNEPGIRDDIDTEFLHDFRVSVRRTRSALSQIRGVFPKNRLNRFKKDFAFIGKHTNRPRDLDVYLLEQDRYRNLLPPTLRPGLDPLFERLADERKAEYRKLARTLKSPRYRTILADWEAFLDPSGEDTLEHPKNARTPVIALARKYIAKKYAHVMALGGAITDNTPDPDLHRLRIECKKLRYLLEFFASLFPPEEINTLVKCLKKLQDNLGDFNDLFVQQEELHASLAGLPPKEETALHSAAAIGGLIVTLHQKQQEVRRAFAQTFVEFSGAENVSLFHKLFG